MAGLTIKSCCRGKQTHFSYIVMQVIWCLKFFIMTKSGGQSPTPNSGGHTPSPRDLRPCSRAFKVTHFSTNRKLIYHFLLVINTNLPPILHRFQVMVKFSLARGECLTLTLSLEVIPSCQYRRKWYITNNYLWRIFLLQKVSVYLQTLLHNQSRKLPNLVKLRSSYGYYAVQDHPRSPILVYQSKAHMRLPISD